MEFAAQAPGELTLDEESGTYIGYWEAAESNFAYTKEQVESWVFSALNGDLGWKRAGIGFQKVPIGRVRFQVVESLPGNIIGQANWGSFPVLVELEAALYGNLDLLNHEAGHAIFYATHLPEDTVSIMEPMEDLGEEWPSDAELLSPGRGSEGEGGGVRS